MVRSEGYGLRTNVQRCCDTLLRIAGVPAAPQPAGGGIILDSLNVSVATGVLLHQLISRGRGAGSGEAQRDAENQAALEIRGIAEALAPQVQ